MTLAISNVVSPYPSNDVLDYMEHQAESFEQTRPKLTEEFLGQYVWFENGVVLDSDENHEALVLRIYGEGEPSPCK